MDKIPHPILNLNLNTPNRKQTVRLILTSHGAPLYYADKDGEICCVEDERVEAEVYGGVVSSAPKSIITFKGNPVMLAANTWVFANNGEGIESSEDD